jgi:hypothetical protein
LSSVSRDQEPKKVGGGFATAWKRTIGKMIQENPEQVKTRFRWGEFKVKENPFQMKRERLPSPPPLAGEGALGKCVVPCGA